MGRVIGTVTLGHQQPALAGGRFLIVQPESAAALRGDGAPASDTLVVYDEIGAGCGARIAFSEGREAAMPFHPRPVPVDAYCAAIMDEVVIAKSE